MYTYIELGNKDSLTQYYMIVKNSTDIYYLSNSLEVIFGGAKDPRQEL